MTEPFTVHILGGLWDQFAPPPAAAPREGRPPRCCAPAPTDAMHLLVMRGLIRPGKSRPLAAR